MLIIQQTLINLTQAWETSCLSLFAFVSDGAKVQTNFNKKIGRNIPTDLYITYLYFLAKFS